MAEEYFSSGVLTKLFSRHAFFPLHYSLFTFLYQTGKSFLQYIYIYQRKYGGKNSNIRTVCSSIFVSCRTKLTASYYFYVYSILFGGKCGYFFLFLLSSSIPTQWVRKFFFINEGTVSQEYS